MLERNINQLPPLGAQPMIEPITYIYPNRALNPQHVVFGMTLQPTGQGGRKFFYYLEAA